MRNKTIGIDYAYGKDHTAIIKMDGRGNIVDVIPEGIFLKDLFRSKVPLDHTWDGETIKSIRKLYNGFYAVRLHNGDKQYLGQWEICRELRR